MSAKLKIERAREEIISEIADRAAQQILAWQDCASNSNRAKIIIKSAIESASRIDRELRKARNKSRGRFRRFHKRMDTIRSDLAEWVDSPSDCKGT